jgi:hypothetical protein
MPSIAEMKGRVRDGLNAEPDHEAILAELQGEIDRHNQATDELRHEHRSEKRRRRGSRSEDADRKSRHLRFRFKSGVRDPKRKRSKREPSHKKREPVSVEDAAEETAHPFPREPAEPDSDTPISNTAAFQTSLFDALADDEAAHYWESVYSQPIHVYTRPTMEIPSGKLESMDDESYATYVQRNMWEKAHPEVVIERDRQEQKRREEADAKEQRRKEFVRDREREAWRRAGRAKATEKDDGHEKYEYVFDFSESGTKPSTTETRKTEIKIYAQAWTDYLSAWEKLKRDLADETFTSTKAASKRIPWPTLSYKPATRPNIEDFMRHITAASTDGKTALQLLKVERVRWHPDKVQQRFAGAVDEGTMKVVTGVFQVVDGLVEEERKKVG